MGLSSSKFDFGYVWKLWMLVFGCVLVWGLYALSLIRDLVRHRYKWTRKNKMWVSWKEGTPRLSGSVGWKWSSFEWAALSGACHFATYIKLFLLDYFNIFIEWLGFSFLCSNWVMHSFIVFCIVCGCKKLVSSDNWLVTNQPIWSWEKFLHTSKRTFNFLFPHSLCWWIGASPMSYWTF